MDLAGAAIPAINQQNSSVAFDVLGVLDMAERGEQVAFQHLAALLHLEVALVVVGLIPHPVRQYKADSEHPVVGGFGHRGQQKPLPSVLCQKQRLVAVKQWHSREVPPAEHPSE